MKQEEWPRLRRWSRGEYARLIDHGILDEDDPVELLDGLLLVKGPQDSPTGLPCFSPRKRWSEHSVRAGSSRPKARSSSMTAPSLSRTSAWCAAHRVTT